MTQKRRIRIDLEYMGANYAGWQVQPGQSTTQQKVEEALLKLVNHNARVTASGRTDAGVHALIQPCHADVVTRMKDEEIEKGLNALLPHDIAALKVITVESGWHARSSAKQKTYRYTILNSRRKSVFDHGRVWRIADRLDIEVMNDAAQNLVGEHDFSSFQGAGCASVDKPVRRLLALKVTRDGKKVFITVTGSGFLKQMVRNIAGSLVEIGRGKEKPEWIIEVLQAKKRTSAGPCAPPEGLCLVDVRYE